MVGCYAMRLYSGKYISNTALQLYNIHYFSTLDVCRTVVIPVVAVGVGS